MMLDYKKFNYQEYSVDSWDKALELLEMFSWECFKKECAMTPRDDKWGYGLAKIHTFIKKQQYEDTK